MICEAAAKMRHASSAGKRLVSGCLSLHLRACQSAVEHLYRSQTGEKDTLARQRRGDIVAVLPRLELAVLDIAVAHASATSSLLRLPSKMG